MMLWIMVAVAGGMAVGGVAPGATAPGELRAWLAQANAQGLEAAPLLSDAQIQRLLAGGRVNGLKVDGQRAGTAYAAAVVALPAEQLWKALVDDEHQARFLGIDESKVVSGTPRADGYVSWQYVDVLGPFDRWWVTRTRFNSAMFKASQGRLWEAAFKDQHQDHAVMRALPHALRAHGSPVAWTRGRWLLVKLSPNRTLIHTSVASDPGGGIPAGLASRFSRGAVADSIGDMEKMARQHTPSCSARYYGPDGQVL